MNHRVLRALGGALLTVLAACASGGAGNPGADMAMRTTTIGGVGSAMAMNLIARESAVNVEIGAAPADVFDALAAAYDALSVPRSRVEREQKLLGAEGLKARRVLGSRQLRALFDCGGTPGMPNAETYDLQITMLSQVSARGTGSVVSTIVSATATSASFNGAPVNCSSNGVLEEELSKLLRARFGG